MSIELIFHQTQLPLDQFAANLMQRRVKQGFPKECWIKIADQPQTAYSWTDGVDSIFSIFTPEGPGMIKEICVVEDR
jgi:hypothetical protein